MKILLATGGPYYPLGRSGNSIVHRYMLDELAACGHTITMICCAHVTRRGELHEAHLAKLQRAGTAVTRHPRWDGFRAGNVEIHAVKMAEDLPSHLSEMIERDSPDRVVVSGPDDRQGMLRAALSQNAIVVYVCQGVTDLPHGPLSLQPIAEHVGVFGRLSGIVGVSAYVADYIRRWLGVDATAIYAPAYGPGPFPVLGSFDAPYVAFVNPSQLKGLEIFLDLVRAFPETEFAAVPSWATTPLELDQLAAIPNVHLLDFVDDIEVLLRQTKVLLVPSLIPEGFGLLPVEAMLRSVPVIASDAGALREAMLGMESLIHVTPIGEFTRERDAVGLPMPVVPAQDHAPWRASLAQLLQDRDTYVQRSVAVRNAATRFVAGLTIDTFEKFLTTARPRPM